MQKPVDLDELAAEMARGKVWECSLRSTNWQMHGLQDREHIYIDPRPAVLETLLHELIHRRYPKLSERRVVQESKRLATQMDETTKRRWWRAYNRIKRKGVPVEVQSP
jgi:hypothetical protein